MSQNHEHCEGGLEMSTTSAQKRMKPAISRDETCHLDGLPMPARELVDTVWVPA